MLTNKCVEMCSTPLTTAPQLTTVSYYNSVVLLVLCFSYPNCTNKHFTGENIKFHRFPQERESYVTNGSLQRRGILLFQARVVVYAAITLHQLIICFLIQRN